MARIVFPCNICGGEFYYFQVFLKHIKNRHSFDPGFQIHCGISGCAKTYYVYSSFRVHLYRCHKNMLIASPQKIHKLFHSKIVQNNILHTESILCKDKNEDNDNIVHHSQPGLYILTLLEKYRVSKDALKFIIDSTETFVEIHNQIHNTNIKTELIDLGIPKEIVNSTKSLTRDIPIHIFDNLRTDYMREKYYMSHFNYVPPVEYRFDPFSSSNETFQYVPILNLLKSMLMIPEVLNTVLNSHSSTDGYLRDYCDGVNYANHLGLSNDICLQIQLYFDEFTVVNPLRNKARIFKLCAFYFTLGNFPPKFRSRVHTMQLINLCRSVHLKKYGFRILLQPLIADLQILAHEGITISKENITIKGYATFLSSDNLGAHMIGGFIESFNSLRVCRMCMATKEQIQNQFDPSSFYRRTVVSYDEQVKLVTHNNYFKRIYGIKQNSALNEIPYFHVVKCLPPDIAHDLFEGVVPHVINIVLQHFISNDYFTSQEVVSTIDKFDYKSTDKVNKPFISLDSDERISFKPTASEAWCLLRLMGLLFGRFIEPGNPQWEVLCLLQEVVSVVCSPIQSNDSIAYMQTLITDFLEEFRFNFPNEPIRPKFHYLIHYPEMTLAFGPLIHCWTLRFESKHGFFKYICNRVRNMKNVCLTLAKRHQKHQCYASKAKQFFSDEITRDGKVIPVDKIDSNDLELCKHLIGDQQNIYRANSVSIGSILYKIGICLVKETHPRYTFWKLLNIYIINSITYLIVKEMKSILFDAHYNCWTLCFTPKKEILQADQLEHFYPLGLYNLKSETCVILKHKIC